MIGKTISHYRILEKLGEGGMGEVYKAEDIKLKRTVALKFLPKTMTVKSEARARFEQEARAAAALNHPNIVTIHEINEHEGQVFIAMEYVEGQTLKEKMAAGPLPPATVIEIASQICDALAAAHAMDIIHRDIKPQNILVDRNNHIKILDFGLAKLSGVSQLTRESSTLGTAHYMSPEQAMGKEVDQRTDLWSLGIALYEMFTGELPFKGDYEQAVIYAILNEQHPKIKTIRPEVPAELERIVERCLQKDKTKRYPGADEIAADLKAVPQPATGTMMVKKKKTGLPLFIGIAILMLAIMAFSYFFILKNPLPVREKSIAVLPFVDMSPQQDQGYFCDGMTEELINRLSNIQSLRVPARTSAFAFKGKTEDIKKIGNMLKVATILEGSVQKSGDRLRITAQLINISDGYHIWSEKYDRRLEDVFTIQDEISTAIVKALQVKLNPEEIEKISDHPIDNIKAYECLLKADREILRFDEKSLDKARDYLQTAIEIMGDNAILFSAMSNVYWQYANIGLQQEDYLIKAKEYALKALKIKPNLPHALFRLGSLATYKEYPRNIQDGFRYFRKALTENPNQKNALQAIATQYRIIGRPNEELAYLDKLDNLDPMNHYLFIARGYHYLYNCQFKKAWEQFHRSYESDPTSPLVKNAYATILVYCNKRNEALAIMNKTNDLISSNVITRFTLLLKYALLNDKKSARQLITPDFRKTCQRDLEWSYWVGNTLALLGLKKEALDWLENAIHRGFINYPFVQCDPFLDNIRMVERFKNLMAKAKYEWEHFEIPE